MQCFFVFFFYFFAAIYIAENNELQARTILEKSLKEDIEPLHESTPSLTFSGLSLITCSTDSWVWQNYFYCTPLPTPNSRVLSRRPRLLIGQRQVESQEAGTSTPNIHRPGLPDIDIDGKHPRYHFSQSLPCSGMRS